LAAHLISRLAITLLYYFSSLRALNGDFGASSDKRF
jgi:hypothetical protein